MKSSVKICLTVLLLAACGPRKFPAPELHAQSDRAGFRADQLQGNSQYRGWDYLVQRLREDGVPEQQIDSIYKSPRMPEFTEVPFKLKPTESMVDYAGFTSQSKIDKARAFLKSYRDTFIRAQSTFGVDPGVIAAILLVETEFGQNLGKHLVIERLSRVSSVAEPNNLQKNYQELRKANRNLRFTEVQTRAHYLEKIFYPEILALLEMCQKNNLDVFELKGSRAGAFGIPQFLPSSYLKFAVDGNQDRIVSLFREDDAIWSVAHFLAKAGWSLAASSKEKNAAIWKYNRSNPYVETVLKIAGRLGKV